MSALRLRDPATGHLSSLSHVFWGACGTAVLLFIFLAALGAFEPGEVVELTVVVLALACAFLAHEWRGLWRAERSGDSLRPRS
ncbi:MAG TPA: hypothetical protein VFQ12_04435 [Thermoleophilaceae bacterium]|nr:hypothetical protein [Thermoleophilaceae bacterium]